MPCLCAHVWNPIAGLAISVSLEPDLPSSVVCVAVEQHCSLMEVSALEQELACNDEHSAQVRARARVSSWATTAFHVLAHVRIAPHSSRSCWSAFVHPTSNQRTSSVWQSCTPFGTRSRAMLCNSNANWWTGAFPNIRLN